MTSASSAQARAFAGTSEARSLRQRLRLRARAHSRARDAIGAREQLVLEFGLVGALHAEAVARRVQRFEMHAQLLAQLRGFGVGARDRDAALRVGDARAFVELLDAAFGGRQRIAQLLDHRRRGGSEIGGGADAQRRRHGNAGGTVDRIGGTAAGDVIGVGLARLVECALLAFLGRLEHRRHLVRAAVIEVVCGAGRLRGESARNDRGSGIGVVRAPCGTWPPIAGTDQVSVMRHDRPR